VSDPFAHDLVETELVELARLALHCPGEVELYVQRLATRHRETSLGMTLAAMVGAPVPQEGPHSRACGWRNHPHGPDCHGNCPTCHGRA
jgi:hypothetical protein